MMQKGQSLFEVIIALAISALIVIALVSMVTNSIRNAVFSKNGTQGSLLSQQTMEWLRSERDKDISLFLSNAQTPSYCLMSLSWSISGACADTNYVVGTQFVRQLDFSLGVVSGKTVVTATVTIKWNDSQGWHEIVNSTNYTDWRQR